MTDYRDTRMYRYFDAVNKCVDFAGMCEDLNSAPENAIIILQVCAHNPTGCDPTREQWMEISNIMKVIAWLRVDRAEFCNTND